MKSLKYMYFDRKKKKNVYKNLWLNRISITCQKHGYKYNDLKKTLKIKNILINNKTIANLFLLDNKIETKLFSI